MDTSGGFFFSFDAPSEASTKEDASAVHASHAVLLSRWPAPTTSTALFPWVRLKDDTLTQWTAAYCRAGSSLDTATKPLHLTLEVPKTEFCTSPAASSPVPPNVVLTFTLCYQTSPEVSTLTEVKRTGTPTNNANAATTAEHRDVIPGRYYGGLKVWSCATLLAEYLVQHAAHYCPLFREAGVVVELGCGQALPGLTALCLGARRVVFQDYNEEVLTVCTKPNLGATVAANRAALSELRPHHNVANVQVKFVHGDWVDLKWEGTQGSEVGPPSSSSSSSPLVSESHPSDAFCDVVLGADITFDEEACGKLACVLHRWLRPGNGEAIIASKDYYFGTNGGYLEFSRSAASHGLQVTLLQRVDTADKMPHVVFRVTHNST